MLLSDGLRRCLLLAMDNEDLNIEQTVYEAFKLHYEITGQTIEIDDEEEGEELVRSCFNFIADEVLNNLILKGAMEVKGVDENGELTFGLTEGYQN